jgi:hypothetical protein
LTVANIRDDDQAGDLEVLFLESARFYRLPRANPSFDRLAALLRRAMTEQRPVRVSIRSPADDVIDDVSA